MLTLPRYLFLTWFTVYTVALDGEMDRYLTLFITNKNAREQGKPFFSVIPLAPGPSATSDSVWKSRNVTKHGAPGVDLKTDPVDPVVKQTSGKTEALKSFLLRKLHRESSLTGGKSPGPAFTDSVMKNMKIVTQKDINIPVVIVSSSTNQL